jgi:shikimate dehydrogenase
MKQKSRESILNKTRQITSATRLAAVIGSPVAQSLSPVIHNAVFESLNVDWLYVAFNVQPARVEDALVSMTALGIGGLSVTMPHKNAVSEIVTQCGEVDEIVRVTNSANTVVLRPDNSLWATNTDGEGCCNALEQAMKSSIKGERVVVLGAGGTASAVAYAVVQRGASDVAVINRTPQRAQDLVNRVAGSARVVSSDETADAISDARIIINTTPVGFGSDQSSQVSPIDISLIKSSHVVLDAVYKPLITGLLLASQKAGATVVDGLSMLVHQAALQQQHWIGQMGDAALMRECALAHLARA